MQMDYVVDQIWEQDQSDRVPNRALDIESSYAFRQLIYFPGRNILRSRARFET